MATKRKRGSSWEFVVRRKGLLPKPLYLTFASEEEGDEYVRSLEALLDRGVVPDEFRRQQGDLVTIDDAARAYLAAQHVPSSDQRCLAVVVDRIGTTRLQHRHLRLGGVVGDGIEARTQSFTDHDPASRGRTGSLLRLGCRRGVAALVMQSATTASKAIRELQRAAM